MLDMIEKLIKSSLLITLALVALLGFSLPAMAGGFSGYLAAEGRFFPYDPLYSGQTQNNASIAVQPEYFHEWENNLSFTFVPFARLDSADTERSHFDIRELNLLWFNDSLELRAGLAKVFWGVTEFVHLVDIINQTDYVESLSGEEKLGQPMVDLALIKDWGTLRFFVLPFFRERTYSGRNGRLRLPAVVDPELTRHESGAEEWHVDFAVRYNHTLGPIDFGIYNFNGTGREPTMLTSLNSRGEPILIPYYEQINQTGLDLQLVVGGFLWKIEALNRRFQGSEDFFAGAGGFEYTFVNFAETDMSLGVIAELARDSRNNNAVAVFDNDLMLGLRLTLNDAASTEVLTGLIYDLNSSARTMSIEAGRRFSDNIKLSLEAGLFLDAPASDLFYSLRDDDFVRIELKYYF